ncbi:MAG: hypothetical protein JWP89_4400 [Schlesneria sp.]|nr:hypothetical protein [Schlesneria sp.]
MVDGRALRPARLLPLFLGFGGDAECDPSVDGQCLKLDAEALAISMWPDATDAGPEALLSLAVADLVSDMAGSLRGGFIAVGVGHGVSPFLQLPAATIAT